MKRLRNRKLIAVVILLATLGTRAATPEGFMPAAPGKGLLFELCPTAVTPGVMAVIRSWQPGGHHMHHGHHGMAGDHGAHDREQCPIGHLLASAAAIDTTWAAAEIPATAVYFAAPILLRASTSRASYSSRDPPSLF
jgi:hypothetical protein